MIDKNLFLYDLAIVAIFKNEAPYLKEWLDYHLTAGVEHFYLYNNDSSDNYQEVLAPYVESNLVTLANISGRGMQMPAYDDAIENYRFDCRYMAFIDLDEFIYPKSARSIAEVADEIFLEDTAALGINWQLFGSNGQETADYSRGVLERFTRRAPSDWIFKNNEDLYHDGNIYIKSIVNPRCVNYFLGPHYAIYFEDLKSINAEGVETFQAGSHPISADKIVINHYYIKSREEFELKRRRGKCFSTNKEYAAKTFQTYDRNEVFDDGILKYRAARADKFSLESDADRIRRAENTLIKILTQRSPLDAPADFFTDKIETFLTCRALAERLGTKIGNKTAEEYALVWIYQTLAKAEKISHAEIEQFTRALPEILARPFPICKKIKALTQDFVIPSFCEAFKDVFDLEARAELIQLQKFLRLIK